MRCTQLSPSRRWTMRVPAARAFLNGIRCRVPASTSIASAGCESSCVTSTPRWASPSSNLSRKEAPPAKPFTLGMMQILGMSLLYFPVCSKLLRDDDNTRILWLNRNGGQHDHTRSRSCYFHKRTSAVSDYEDE